MGRHLRPTGLGTFDMPVAIQPGTLPKGVMTWANPHRLRCDVRDRDLKARDRGRPGADR